MQNPDALHRIDAALTRIEAQLSAPGPTFNHADAGVEQLRAAHQRLRGRVEDAIAAIDRMLEER